MKQTVWILVALLVMTVSGWTQDSEPTSTLPDPMIDQAARQAIDKGLSWLAANQTQSGSWGESASVAITSMAGMAFAGDGNIPGRGKYGEVVRKAVDFLMRNSGKSGYINEGNHRGSGGSGMHGHGYATMFLTQVYGMTQGIDKARDEDLKTIIQNAIDVIEASQSGRGGWYYEPANSRGANGSDEGSVTVTVVQALRAARDAGFSVDIKVIEKAVDYIHKSTNPDGTVRYSQTSGSNHTTFALTAAGVSVMNALGEYHTELTQKGIEYCARFRPGGGMNSNGWFYYGHLYAGIAMMQNGGDEWRKWYPAIRKELVKKQALDGSWTDNESQRYGAAFGTAFALVVLELPGRYLPIYAD